MSLQVWLPLTKDAQNYGVNGAITSSTATFEDGGKIGGKCLTNGTITIPAANAGQFLNNNSFSYACWIYVQPGAESSGGAFFGTETMETNNNRKFSLFQYPNPVDLHWSWQNDTANATYTSGVLSNFFISGGWTHIAVTYQNPNIKIYKNGQLYHSATGVSNSSSFAYLLNVAKGKTSHRKMNDVRIYDHCLSQKEVKELAKGLVLHYRLAGPGQENLIKNSTFTEGTLNWYGVNSSVIKVEKIDNKLCLTGTKGTTSNLYGFGYVPYTTVGQHDIYTFSADIYITTAATWTCGVMLSTTSASGWQGMSVINQNYHNTQNLKVGWNHVKFSFECYHNSYTGNLQIYFGCPNFDTYYLYMPKLEKGSIATPWTPNKADTLWTAMGYSNNVEYDCSGFGYNGTKNGELTWNVDSPRYTTSYKVGLTKAYVSTPNIAFEQMPQGTLNMWINRHSSTSDWRLYALFANTYNWTSTEKDFIIIGSTGGTTICLDCCSNTYQYTPTLNKWHMYTITWDLQQHTSSIYIDGEFIRTVTSAKIDTLYASKHDNHAFGNQISSDVNDYSMSDARIYSTVLSAEAVAELYHSAVIIDNTGKTYAYEYFEG